MKIEYEADDKKTGMRLDELLAHIEEFAALAETKEIFPEDISVKVFVNFSAGIKQLVLET